jgi:glycosyltransferase involved in cell wall biosynthesis
MPLALLARLLGRSGRGRATARALCHGMAEAELLQERGHRSVAFVEGPVDRAYFDVTQQAARHPLIVSASRTGDVRGAEAFDQLAVLLGGDTLGLGFNWIGPLDAVSATRLKAAAVGVFDSARHTERATRLAAAWMFVALSGERGFPLCLAEAMATGLPCVALDTPAHRSLVRHGDTGYLCRSQAEVIDRIAQLADTPSLRERMGRAGRDLARERFGQARFEHSLFAAYAAAAAAGAPAASPVPARQGALGLKEVS